MKNLPGTVRWFIAIFALALTDTVSGASPPVAAVFRDASVAPPALARTAADVAESAGYNVSFIDVSALTNNSTFAAPSGPDLLILPHGNRLPAMAVGPVSEFVKHGGNVLALGAPLWDTPLIRLNDRWVTRTDYETVLLSVSSTNFPVPFHDVPSWTHSSDQPTNETKLKKVDGGKLATWHVTVPDLMGWDTFTSGTLKPPFAQGHTLTVFKAKGTTHTKVLVLEWRERDGSRWIASVELAPEWKTFVLPPSEFKAWPTPEAGASRVFQPSNAVSVSFGLASSHGTARGRHEYWISALATAAGPFGVFEPPLQIDLPHMEGLAPSYIAYPLTGPLKVVSTFDVLGKLKPIAAPSHPVKGLHPRPQGGGFAQARGYRWQPLLEAHSSDGDYRGQIGVLRTDVKGGSVAAFTPVDAEFYEQQSVKDLLAKTLVQMRRGLYLADGGAEFFTVFTHQSFRVGSQVLNHSDVDAQMRVRITAAPRQKSGPAFTFETSLLIGARSTQTVQTNWTPLEWPRDGYIVTTELFHNDQLIDRLSHSLHSWQPKAKPEFIQSRDGGFWLGGKRWKAHGVNYMPSSGIGLKNGNHFEHWIGKAAYDPIIIDRDLRRVRGMGMNAVSVFIYRQSMEGQHLLDLLRRCEDLGLKVNLSLRPGTPMQFRWDEMRELIEYYRLASNDTVFAYDLAWEPCHYTQSYQEKHYTEEWRKWVENRYRSIDAARKAWDASATAEFTLDASAVSALAVPTMQQLTTDGPWRKMIADYRLFLDELLAEKYGEARRLVRTLDTNHAVSFRMQHAGDPTLNWVELLPYDFWGLRNAVDIWEPEAYGRIGDWERVKPGHFTSAYARLCDPGKPVIWAEIGYTVWDMKRMTQNPERLAFTAQYYADFYRMMIESRVDGVFFWWYPGGFRVGENSDFGIINPDGTDRDITRVIRNNGPKFLATLGPAKPDYWINIDRDRDARGLFAVYESVQAEYWRAVANGKTPGLRWIKKPGE